MRTLFVALMLCATPAYSAGLGHTDSEFQEIKERIKSQIKGSEATVSEVDVPKFNDADLAKIALARKQLQLIK